MSMTEVDAAKQDKEDKMISAKIQIRFSLDWFNPAWFGCLCLVWFGLVWFGLVWFGLVWFWFGLVFPFPLLSLSFFIFHFQNNQ
jgi:hypothetical protein